MSLREEFEQQLFDQFQENSSSTVEQAMVYALKSGGKRIRPLLLLSTLDAYAVPMAFGYSCANAIEMIHTYSLIHDDLPAMDNDDYRRGKLTCHKQFDEATAILAGDALLTNAFDMIVLDEDLSDYTKVKLLHILSESSGYKGMIFGQELDIASEGKTISLSDLQTIHHHKTGQLISLPLIIGGIIANKEEDIIILRELGFTLGLAFQIQDDIFDVTKNLKKVGTISSDLKNKKITYVSLLGLDNARQSLKECFLKCYELIDSLHLSNSTLFELIQGIETRDY